MIKIIDDWYITVEPSPTNYVVRRGTGRRGRKNEWTDKAFGYFGSLRKAVKFIREQIIAETLSSGSRPLPDALQTISSIDDRFEEIIGKIGA